MAKSESIINGVLHKRVFAFQHKAKPDLFGTLEADDYETAKETMGKPYYVRSVMIPESDLHRLSDRDFTRELVENSIKAGNHKSKGSK